MAALLGEYWIEALKLAAAAVAAIVVRELHSRARSRTKVMTSEDDAQVSVLAEVRAEKVQAVLREAVLLKQIEDLQKQLNNMQTKATVTAMLSASDPERAAQIAQDSGYIDPDRQLRPRPAPRPPAPSHDRFMAAKPFEPPPTRPRRDAPPDPELRIVDPGEYLKDRK